MRQRTQAAVCASAIRKELKSIFPQIKFKIKSENYAGGDSVHISWWDKPITKEVNNIVKKYQYGNFNGMIDLYEYDNDRTDIPQVRYVFAGLCISDEKRNFITKQLEKQGITYLNCWDKWKMDINTLIYRILHKNMPQFTDLILEEGGH